MIVNYHPKFKKQYTKLQPAQRQRFAKALSLFTAEPMHQDLRNHALTGGWLGYRSISFGGDWRAHYKVISETEAIFVAIGTHSQLYK